MAGLGCVNSNYFYLKFILVMLFRILSQEIAISLRSRFLFSALNNRYLEDLKGLTDNWTGGQCSVGLEDEDRDAVCTELLSSSLSEVRLPIAMPLRAILLNLLPTVLPDSVWTDGRSLSSIFFCALCTALLEDTLLLLLLPIILLLLSEFLFLLSGGVIGDKDGRVGIKGSNRLFRGYEEDELDEEEEAWGSCEVAAVVAGMPILVRVYGVTGVSRSG